MEPGERSHANEESCHKSQGKVAEEARMEGTEEGEEIWLVSYADMMTLLFGLFAMLFSLAVFEEEGSIRVDKKLLKYFGGTVAERVQDAKSRDPAASSDLPGKLLGDLRVPEEGIELSFVSSTFFPSGGTEITPEAEASLKQLVDILRGLDKNTYAIAIEGHTDDTPSSGKQYASNWEFSALRAASVVRAFLRLGYPAHLLSATGYGETRPLVPNRDADGNPIPENQKANRRVVIKVIRQPENKTQ